jgi:hypothetical protein
MQRATAPRPILLQFTDHFVNRHSSLSIAADDKLLPPAEHRAQIIRPLELVAAAAWFYEQESPVHKRRRQEPPPPVSFLLAQYSPGVPVRIMPGCVAATCQWLVTAPAKVFVTCRTTWRWSEIVMERVTRGHARRMKVRPAAALAAFFRRPNAPSVSRAPQQTLEDVEVCCRCINLLLLFIPYLQAAAGAHIQNVQGKADIIASVKQADGALVLCHLLADSRHVTVTHQ